MKALLIPVGSAGDVHPFLGIGTRLKKRGHEVTVITNEVFGPLARRTGLDFIPLGSAAEFNELAKNPDLWDPRRAFFLIAKQVTQSLRPMYDTIKKNFVPGKTIVAAGSLALASRIAEEKLNVPTATIHLQPAVLRSYTDPPKLPSMSIPKWFPPFLVKMVYGLADQVVDRAMGQGVNKFRAELDLPPVKGIMDKWWSSPHLTIGLFPEWYAPSVKNFLPSLHLTDFQLFDGDGVENTDPDVEEFFKAGPPPVIFTAGSAMKVAHSFFEEAVRVSRRLNRRGALIARFAEQIPKNLPDGVRHFSYAPFSRIFPQAAVVVQAGGIGTTAQCLRAGVPQLVTPFSHDQPDNADRVVKMGAGLSLSAHMFKASAAAPLVEKLLDDPRFKENARMIAARFQNESGRDETCNLLEGLL